MLRGVNRQIIEITNTESTVFEKVVLYIRPEYSDANDEKIEKKAMMYISSLKDEAVKRNVKQKAKNINAKTFIVPISLLIIGVTVLLIKSIFF